MFVRPRTGADIVEPVGSFAEAEARHRSLDDLVAAGRDVTINGRTVPHAEVKGVGWRDLDER